MSFVLRLNGTVIASAISWNPVMFGKLTDTSFPREVDQTYVWTNGGHVLVWEVDPPYVQTQEEIDAAALRAIKEQLFLDAKADAGFNTLKGATLAQINTFVNNNFGTMNATQRAFIKLLAASASLYLQDR